MKYIVTCDDCKYWYESINEKAVKKIAVRHTEVTGHTCSTVIISEPTIRRMPDA